MPRPVQAAFGALPWLGAAIFVLFFALVLPPEYIIGLLLALGLIRFASRRPDLALLTLLALLPFHNMLLAKLYAFGAPLGVIEPLAAWKEALIIGIVFAGLRGLRASRWQVDRLDCLGFAFVIILFAYAAFPTLFAPNAPSDFSTLSYGLRQTAAFALLLLAARHAQLPADFALRAAKVVIAAAVVVAAVAVYEFAFSDAWNDFVVRNLEYGRYQVHVLEIFPFNPLDYRVYGTVAGEEIVRIGSVFLNPLACGFYLLVGLAFSVERVTRLGARPGAVAAVMLIGAAILFTQTRSAIIGALAIAIVMLAFAPHRMPGRRAQLAMVVAIGLLFAVPAAVSTGLADRAQTTASSDDPTAPDHLDALEEGVAHLFDYPLGRGIGTSAGIGQRFNQVTIVSENNYLQIGTEIGILGMVVFIALTISLILALRRAALATGDSAVVAVWAATIGLAIGAFFLHTWTEFAVAWSLWGLAGAMLGVAAAQTRSASAQAPEPEPEAVLADRARGLPAGAVPFEAGRG